MILGSRTTGSVGSVSDVTLVFTKLCERLYNSRTAAEFILTARTLHSLLEEQASYATQWNIDQVLSTVSRLSSNASGHHVMSTCPKSYIWLCRLVQAVVRRHRQRLEGHFHLLISTLQALLRNLVLQPYDASGQLTKTKRTAVTVGKYPHWPGHAAAFDRLLTLVCVTFRQYIFGLSRRPLKIRYPLKYIQ